VDYDEIIEFNHLKVANRNKPLLNRINEMSIERDMLGFASIVWY
jgi:hypothetical protein